MARFSGGSAPFHEYRIIKIDGNDLNDSDRLRGKISFPPGKHSLVLECTLPEPRFNHPKTADLSGTFESGKEYFVLFIGYSKGPLFPVLWDNAIIESSDAERGIIYLKDGGTIRKPNANQKLQPTVTTPLESGNEQGTAAEL